MKLSTTIIVQSNEEDYVKQSLDYKRNHVIVITKNEEKDITRVLLNFEKICIRNAKHKEMHFERKISDITFMYINDYNLIRIVIFSW